MSPVEALAQNANTILMLFEGLDVDLLDDIALRREMQLSPRLGLSCDPLFEFRLGYNAAGSTSELFRIAHRS